MVMPLKSVTADTLTFEAATESCARAQLPELTLLLLGKLAASLGLQELMFAMEKPVKGHLPNKKGDYKGSFVCL